MSELQNYYDSFNQGWWANTDADRCPCHGGGWALSDLDTWHHCPFHFKGQPHPEDHDVSCPECGDGANFSPADCPLCKKYVREDMIRIDEDTGDMPF